RAGRRSGCDGGAALFADLEAQVSGDDGGGVVVERLVDRGDGAVGEQRLDDLGDGQSEQRGEIGHGHDRWQFEGAGLGGASGGGGGGLGGAALEGFELAAATTAGLAR